VTIRNDYGSTLGAIYVAVIAPEIKNVSVKLRDCEEPNCQLSIVDWLSLPLFPSSEDSQDQSDLFPPWYFDDIADETTTPAPTTIPSIPNLPPFTYHVDSKVCFHVSLNLLKFYLNYCISPWYGS